MTRTRAALWLPLVFVPLTAWSKDATVVVLLLAAIPFAISGARPRVPWPMFAFAIWTAVSLLWARELDWGRWLLSWVAIGAGAVLVSGLLNFTADKLNALPGAVMAAVGTLFGLLLVERITGAGLIGIHRTGDSVGRLFNVLSAGLAFLCCLTYPTALLILRRSCIHAAAIFVAAIFGLALSYNMDAAPLSLALGASAFVIVWRGGHRAFYVVLGLLTAAALAWGFVAAMALNQGLAQWLTDSIDLNWGFRVEIWARVTSLIGEHPWFGHGFGAGRLLGRPDTAGGPVPVPFMHPHNGMLQVWLEFGLVGVVLLVIWAIAAARALVARATDSISLATGAATIAAATTFWLVSFGIWAGWWLAALGLTAAALALALRSDVRAVAAEPGLKHQNAP